METKASKYGRGVFATIQHKAGDVVEVCSVIVLSSDDTEKIYSTSLYDYYYSWGVNGDQSAIALGHGSLYNHSYKPNVKYIKNQENNSISFVAIRHINKGDELLINYNGDPDGQAPLWFDVDA